GRGRRGADGNGPWGVEPLFARWIGVVVEAVLVERKGEDLELALRGAPPRLADVPEDGRPDHRRERGNDRDHHQQLDEREGRPRCPTSATEARMRTAMHAITRARHAGLPPPL